MYRGCTKLNKIGKYWFYYSPLCLEAELGNIGEGPVCLAICQSVQPCAFLHDGGWNFFMLGTMIRYHWLADACKIKFGSVSNLSNYGNSFINVEYLLWYLREECGDLFHIWYSYQVQCIAHVCKIAFGSTKFE